MIMTLKEILVRNMVAFHPHAAAMKTINEGDKIITQLKVRVKSAEENMRKAFDERRAAERRADELALLNDGLRRGNGNLDKAYADVVGRNRELAGQKFAAEIRAHALDRKVVDLRKSVAEREKAYADAAEKHFEYVEKENRELRVELDRALAHHRTLSGNLEHAQTDLAKIRAERDRAVKAREAAINTLDALRADTERYVTDLEHCLSHPENLMSVHTGNVPGPTYEVAKKVWELMGQINMLAPGKAGVTTELEKLRGERDSALTDLAKLRTETEAYVKGLLTYVQRTGHTVNCGTPGTIPGPIQAVASGIWELWEEIDRLKAAQKPNLWPSARISSNQVLLGSETGRSVLLGKDWPPAHTIEPDGFAGGAPFEFKTAAPTIPGAHAGNPASGVAEAQKITLEQDARIASLSTELKTYKDAQAISAGRIECLKTRYDRLVILHQELRKKYHDVRKDRRDIRYRYGQVTQNNEILRKQRDDLMTANFRLKGGTPGFTKTLEDLVAARAETADRDRKITRITADLEKARSEAASAKDELEALQKMDSVVTETPQGKVRSFIWPGMLPSLIRQHARYLEVIADRGVAKPPEKL